MKTFKTYEDVSKMKNCRKKPIVIQALKMEEDFRFDSLEGDYKQGEKGDYLVRGVQGELYICDKEIFEKTYDWV